MNATREPGGRRKIPTVPILGFYAGPRALPALRRFTPLSPPAEYTEIPGTGRFLILEKSEEFSLLLLGFLSKLNS
jgi:pimeloyl-ACP methyl ester carboxylesterase